MGVYIKDMEMPTSCMTCLFQNPYMGGWCSLLNDNSNAYSRRRDCPLIPVPKHGRLIDADKEMARVKRLYDNAVDKDPEMGCVNVYEGEIAVLQLAPTVIPASDKDTNVLGK